ncbi:MAG: hypothetical protein ACK46A_09975 [Akkermansiaceae bacterium]|jgi:hypothetical protein
MKISKGHFHNQVLAWGLIVDPRDQGIEEDLSLDLEVIGKADGCEYLKKCFLGQNRSMVWIKSWHGCSHEEVEFLKSHLGLSVKDVLSEDCWFEFNLPDQNLIKIIEIIISSPNGWIVYIYLENKILLIWESEIIDVFSRSENKLPGMSLGSGVAS